MILAPVSDNEENRVAALLQYDILDTTPEPAFDNLARLASQLCATPIALIAFLDAGRQWFKARIGLETSHSPRGVAFCAHTIQQSDLLMVRDASRDERFSDYPFVTGLPHIKFYAGIPLINGDGQALGTLCVMDHEPRDLSPTQIEALRALGRQVVFHLELRRGRRDLEQAAEETKAAAEALRTSDDFKSRIIEGSRDCIKILDLEGRLLYVNAGGMAALEICDLEPVLNTSWIDFWRGEDREQARRAIEEASRGRLGRFIGYFPTTITARPMWWDVVVTPIKDAEGKPEKLLALSRDVTELKRTEQLVRAVTEGTAAVTGEEFFRALVRHLATALHLRYAFVAECLPNDRARSLAFWRDGAFGENFDYDLAGTPCLEVVSGRACFHPERLQQLFPTDAGLVSLQADSYHGVPVLDSARRIVGHLVVIDDRPMREDSLRLAVMETFAMRAGAEIERQRADEAIRRLNQELAALLDMNRAIGRHLNRDELFGALASSLRTLVPADHFGIELPIEGERLQGHILASRGEDPGPTHPTILPAPGTACDWVIQHRQWVIAAARDELRERFPVTFDVMASHGVESLCAMPLASGERCRGALFFMAVQPGAYAPVNRELLEHVVDAVSVAVDDCLAHEEVQRLRDRLAVENVYLREEIKVEHNFEEIIGSAAALKRVLKSVQQVAATDSTVLIAGETGTGKELIARAIHNLSGRKKGVLVKVNCAAIPAGLIESELFGHERGAFTGALTRKVGRFELADGATLFLDEIGELPPDLQPKLLRVLQEGEFERLGNPRTLKVNVRLIAATNRNLEQSIEDGTFRSDLYYRLNVFPIHLPPLRDRQEDIPLLVKYFTSRYSAKLGKKIETVPKPVLDTLQAYPWPGNIRELENVIERAVILTQGKELDLGDWLPRHRAAPNRSSVPTLEELERRHILEVLAVTGWRVSGERGAAQLLGLKPTTLEARMKKLGIHRQK